jgi:ABC-type glycerol-3-phosphate transport system permease component
VTPPRDTTSWEFWGRVMIVPYLLIFLVFVLYPVGYGLWLARHPQSYVKLFEDPIFFRTAINTVVFLVVGINIKMVVALLLSGFFLHERWWIKALSMLFILPWAVPMYKAMSVYGLLNSQWALILAMVTIASPYCIWVLKQASDKLPWELDEAARIDGATALQLFRLVYLPLMVPSLVAVGTYALLLAWNEYLYAFLLLSRDDSITLSVALGNFMAADDSPWELLMATGFIYALPPAAIYYAFKRYMVGGLTAGAVKS